MFKLLKKFQSNSASGGGIRNRIVTSKPQLNYEQLPNRLSLMVIAHRRIKASFFGRDHETCINYSVSARLNHPPQDPAPSAFPGPGVGCRCCCWPFVFPWHFSAPPSPPTAPWTPASLPAPGPSPGCKLSPKSGGRSITIPVGLASMATLSSSANSPGWPWAVPILPIQLHCPLDQHRGPGYQLHQLPKSLARSAASTSIPMMTPTSRTRFSSAAISLHLRAPIIPQDLPA